MTATRARMIIMLSGEVFDTATTTISHIFGVSVPNNNINPTN